MNGKSIVPVVTTTKMQATRDFYIELLGFEISFDHYQYLGVRAGPKGAPELGFMPPGDCGSEAFGGKGITLGITVADADAECARLRQQGVAILQEPTDEPWGARGFVIQDPNGVVLLISHPIRAAVEFAACVR